MGVSNPLGWGWGWGSETSLPSSLAHTIVTGISSRCNEGHNEAERDTDLAVKRGIFKSTAPISDHTDLILHYH